MTSAAALGMPVGALLGGFLGDLFAPHIPVLICGVSMIVFSLYWLSSSVLRKLPKIEDVNLFMGKKVQA